MPQLYLLRHGKLEANPEHRFIGQQEKQLAAAGRQQARFWQQELKDIAFAAAICSDMERCREMAALVLAGRTLPITADSAFREIHLGKWEGLRKDEVETRWPGALARRGQDFWNYRPCGGESFAMLALRVLPALGHWLGSVHEQDNILLVAHAGVNRIILMHVLALRIQDMFALPQPYAACSRLFFSAKDIEALQNYQ